MKKEVAVLWDAVWQPAGQGVYPDRPASPGRKGPTAAETAAGEFWEEPRPFRAEEVHSSAVPHVVRG